MFTIYNKDAIKLEPLFGGHYFWPPFHPIEGNIWGTKYGRGTFSKYYNKGLKVLNYQKKPFEIKYKQKIGKNGIIKKERKKIFVGNETINAKLAEDFEDFLDDKNVLIKCDTAENLGFIPDESIDTVITDPPYYDNIMYSELSDFFYIWLRLGLKNIYPKNYNSLLTRKDREILVNTTQGKDEDFYIESMTRVFRETYRVLKKDGIMTFVFQHKKSEAWTALLKALLKADFQVIAVYPTHGETPSGIRAAGLSYNSILVCRKRIKRKHQQIPWIIFESELRSNVDTEIDVILNNHPELEVEDAFIISIGKALEVYSNNYGTIIKDGKIFDISEISMGIIGDVVFDSLMRKILARIPDVDRISKIYGCVFVKKKKISNDMINKLTRHGGLDTNLFEENNLVKKDKKSGIMAITPPEEREEYILNKIKRGLPLNYIDAAHILWIARVRDEDLEKNLDTILRTGLDKKRLEQYIRFIANRTNNIVWKKIDNSFKYITMKTIDDFTGEET